MQSYLLFKWEGENKMVSYQGSHFGLDFQLRREKRVFHDGGGAVVAVDPAFQS